jgi:predicted lipid-binding transport protein (Tim44 family)
MSDFEILFFAAVAIFFGYKLYTTFGKTNGDEAARAAQQTTAWKEREKAVEAAKSKNQNNIIELNANKVEVVEEEIPAHLKDGVEAARKLEKDFSLKKFITGATGAFELVIEGFAQKKREALQFLLSKDIYESFDSEMKKRETDEIEANSHVVSMKEPEIMDVEVKNNICHIVVKFISEQINFLKNKAGEVVDGSKSQIEHVTDIWTFERDLTAKKQSWTVVGIQSA